MAQPYDSVEQQPLSAEIASRVLIMISNGISAEDATSKYIQVPFNQSEAFDDFWEMATQELKETPIKEGQYIDIPSEWV